MATSRRNPSARPGSPRSAGNPGAAAVGAWSSPGTSADARTRPGGGLPRLPSVRLAPREELAAAARVAPLLRAARDVARWAGEQAGLAANAKEILVSVRAMPRTMRQLAWVQICTWLGLFCMWLYFPVAVARNVFGASDTTSPLYSAGVEWAGLCFGMYSLVCFGFSFLLPGLARQFGRKATHSLCLICGALGLLSVAVIHSKYLLLLSMTGVGVAWASTLAMPYAILAGSLPYGKTGVYMGIFNFFIVIPEITASLLFGWVMAHLLNNNRLSAVVAGGIFFFMGALLMQRVEDLYEVRQKSSSLPTQAVAAKR